MEDKEKEKPRTFKELIAGFDGEYEYEEWDTGKEDIYNNPEYMKRLLESKKQIEDGKCSKKELIDE